MITKLGCDHDGDVMMAIFIILILSMMLVGEDLSLALNYICILLTYEWIIMLMDAT